MKQVLPEKINKITLDFKSKKLFINDITVDSEYDYLDICFDGDDLEIFISNNRGESTSVSYIQEDSELHLV